MKKRFVIGALLLAAGMTAWAAPLTPEEALGRLAGSRIKAAAAQGRIAPELVHTALSETGIPAVYVFNRPEDGGYLLLSADDEAYPVLGYSDSGEFDGDNMPPALRWWMDEYARQIAYAANHTEHLQNSGAEARLMASRAARTPIAPMLSTRWDQIAPYNNQCPLVGVERTFTGCVATAMAQLMKYWNYPERGRGSVSYNAPTIEKHLTLNFATRAFDWDNMLDEYIDGRYTDTQASAVAYLMKACGYAVKMDYSTDASGALAMNIRAAMVRNFDYDAKSSYHLRMMYSTNQWEEMIYDALKVGPILYGGGSFLGGGHSFVCDGYDGDGFFHFNWGWSGMSDGYFALDALNPDALGSGGGSGGGYNFTQDAVINLRPSTGDNVEEEPDHLIQMGSLIAIVENDSLKLDLDDQADAMWVNYNPTTMYVKIGAHFEPVSGGATKAFDIDFRPDIPGWQIQSGYGTNPYYVHPAIDLRTTDIPDGSYRVSVYTLDTRDESAEWIPTLVPYGFVSSVTFNKSGNKATVTYDATPVIDIQSAEFTTPLYMGCAQKVKVVLRNDNDIELSMGLAPVLFGSQGLDFMGESVLVTVPAHSTVTKEWTTQLYQFQQYVSVTEPTPYMLTFMDENTYLILSDQCFKEVVMNPMPSRPTFSMFLEPSIAGAKVQTTADGTTALYTINDPLDIPVTVSYRLTSGYFGYPVYANLCVPVGNGYVDIVAQSSAYMFMSEDSKRATATIHLGYPLMEPGEDYLLVMGYAYAGQLEIIPPMRNNFVRLAVSGVDDVTVDSSNLSIVCDRSTGCISALSSSDIMMFEAYAVTGSRIGAPAVLDGNSATITLSGGYHGLVIATARDAAGNVRTMKFSL